MPAVGQAEAQLLVHANTVPPLVLIAVAWKVPVPQGVQTMSDVAVPAAE